MKKLFVVVLLVFLFLASVVGIGACLWVSWALYAAGDLYSSIFMGMLASAFITYEVLIVSQNKSDIIKDLKGLWHG